VRPTEKLTRLPDATGRFGDRSDYA